MDILFLVFIIMSLLVGVFKGGVKTAFSLLSFVGSLFVAFLFYETLSQKLWGFCGFGESVRGVLKGFLDGKVDGRFDNQSGMLNVLENSKLPKVFVGFFQKLLNNISFDGELSFGEVFASSLSWGVVKLLAFVLTFVLSQLLFKIVIVLVLKIVKKNSFLRFGDKVLGGMFGALKGILCFGLIYFLILQIANLTLNETLLGFVQNSTVVNLFYEKTVFPLWNGLF